MTLFTMPSKSLVVALPSILGPTIMKTVLATAKINTKARETRYGLRYFRNVPIALRKLFGFSTPIPARPIGPPIGPPLPGPKAGLLSLLGVSFDCVIGRVPPLTVETAQFPGRPCSFASGRGACRCRQFRRYPAPQQVRRP